MQIYDKQGQRLYLTESERNTFLEATAQAEQDVRTFCMVLTFTGCRISEALALTPKGIDFEEKAIIFETLKKRTKRVYRAVPVPENLLDTLDMVHGLKEGFKGKRAASGKIWPWSRMTAYRRVIEIMEKAGIPDGPNRSPKGLRHGFGVLGISKGIPLNMLSKWMGHASLEVTAIYANALGEEQRAIAARMWEK